MILKLSLSFQLLFYNSINKTTITTSTVIKMSRGCLPPFEMVKKLNVTLPTEQSLTTY